MNDFNGTAAPSYWLLLCALSLLACNAGSGLLEAGSAQPRNAMNAAFKSFLASLIPPAAFFLLGVTISDWPLSRPSSTSARILLSADLVLAGGILSRILSERIRLQPFVIALLALCAILLPLGLALEQFAWIFQSPHRDDGHLGLISATAAAFALSHRFATPAILGQSDKAPANLAQAAEGALLVCCAWISAALGSAPSFEDASHTFVALLVSAGASSSVLLFGSWVGSGIAPAKTLLRSGIAGILAAAPMASSLTPPWAAFMGVVGAFACTGLGRIMDRHKLDDAWGASSLHLGSGMAGLLGAAFWPAQHAGPSTSSIALQVGVTLVSLASALLAGMAFWATLGMLIRLDLSPDERETGLDFTEHGHPS